MHIAPPLPVPQACPRGFAVTDEQRRRLREDGYFITPRLVEEAALVEARNEFMRLWEQAKTPQGAGAAALTGNDATRLAFLANLHRINPAFARLCRHPELTGLARQMLGPDVDLSWNQMILKAAKTGKSFAWHQDARYLITEPLDTGLTVWLAITHTTIANGTLRVLPGAHQRGLLPHTWDPLNQEWRGDYDTSRGIAVELEPGQALVFGRMLPHASGPNLSDGVRMAYQLGYSRPGPVVDADGRRVDIDNIPVLRAGLAV